MYTLKTLVAAVWLMAAFNGVSAAENIPTSNATLDALQYRNLGPVRGGRVTAVAGTVSAPSTFYLGATGGGVWKTEDYGTRWKNVSDGFFNTPSIGDIAVAQNDANLLYVGTGSDGLRSNVIVGKGVYKSIDAGTTWQHIGLHNVGQIGAVEIDPTDNNTVYVAAIGQPFNANKERGLYKTTDGGRTWKNILFIADDIGISDVEILPSNPNVIYASAWKGMRKPWTIISGGTAAEGGIYKSIDGGESWDKLTNGLPTDLMGKIDLAVTPADSRVLVALVEAPGDEGGLYRSVDQGEHFTLVSNKKVIRSRPFYYTNVDLDPTNADIVYVNATYFSKSVDGGHTWKTMNVPHMDSHDMWINPNNPDVYIQANDGGANVTLNGGISWSTQFNQPTAELYQVEVDDQYPYWLYAGQQDNSTTLAVPSRAPFGARDRARWIVDTGGCETGPALPKPGNHNIVYANCKGRFGVYDKRTGTEKAYYVGASNMYGHNPKDLKYRFQRVAPIHVSPHDADTVYHTSQYVHRTRDDGVTWETISPDLTANDPKYQMISGSPITRDITGEEFYGTIYSIRESSVKKGVIWVGSNDGLIHVTKDDGKTWLNVTPSKLPKGGRVDAVEPSPHSPAKAYISVLRYQLGDFKPYIYKTENYGKKWQLLTSGKNGIPQDQPTRVVREDLVQPGLLYAGTEFGLFFSHDDGKHWQSLQQNLPVTPVTDMKLIRDDLAVSTMGRGFWVLDNISTLRQGIDAIGGEQVVLFKPKDTIRYRQPKAMPRSDGALPEYPVPSVLIDYYLPNTVSSPVTLDIVNVNGEVVNSFHSATTASNTPTNDKAVSDMATNFTTYITDESLSSAPGLHRFQWRMNHIGAWHTKQKRRYKYGQMAMPGTYTVRLTVDGIVQEQAFELKVDPRVLESGVSVSDIAAQTKFGLKVTSLLSQARQYLSGLNEQRTALSQKDDSDSLQQREAIADKLAIMTAEDKIYPMPKLLEQIEYLSYQVNRADQKPSGDALKQYEMLRKAFEEVKATKI